MNPLLISALIIFVAACLVYVSVKKIAATIYIKTVLVDSGSDSDLPESPYSIYPAQGKSGMIGFAILKNGKHMKFNSSQYTVYHDLNEAVRAMNQYEKLDRVRITNLD